MRPVCQNELMVPRHEVSSAGRPAFSVAAPLSVWNYLAHYLRDPAAELNSFRCQLQTFLFARYYAQRIGRVGDIMTVCYINLVFTYLFTYCRAARGRELWEANVRAAVDTSKF